MKTIYPIVVSIHLILQYVIVNNIITYNCYEIICIPETTTQILQNTTNDNILKLILEKLNTTLV